MGIFDKFNIFGKSSLKADQKTLEEILEDLNKISDEDPSAEKKLKTLLESNNQLDNGQMNKVIRSIPFLKIFGEPSESEKLSYKGKVAEVKTLVRLRIIDLLDNNKDVSDINIEDIILSKQVKENIEMIDTLLSMSSRLSDYGIMLPNGFLFSGPSGVGKTESARWISKNNNTNFFYVSMSDIIHGIVGESEKAITEVFTKARNQALLSSRPSMIFIDEADKTLRDRSRDINGHSNVQHFLSLIDGFHKNKDVIVTLATNTPKELDPAILSRMSVKVQFDLPDIADIEKIFSIHFLKNVVNDGIYKSFQLFIVDEKDGLEKIFKELYVRKASGRDIKNITQSAKTKFMLRHVHNVEEKITINDIECGIDQVLPESN